MTDIKTLAKDPLFSEAPDVPNVLNMVVPNPKPESSDPLDQSKLELYVRLNALPSDVRRIVSSLLEAYSIAEQVVAAVPGLEKPEPTYYPNGVAELQWKLDNSAVFGLIISNSAAKLTEENNSLKVEKRIKIGWRFHGPRQRPTSGEFKDLAEVLDFMTKSFIVR